MERIAYVGCSTPMVAQRERLAGYRAALADAGLAYDDLLVCDVERNDGAMARVERLFDVARPDGFFCFNDARAWYVYQCAAERGLKVGRDLSVVGVDNHPVVNEMFSPELTTVELPHYEMGYWAAMKLIAMVEGDPDRAVDWPATRTPLPPLGSPSPVRLRCAMVERASVRA